VLDGAKQRGLPWAIPKGFDTSTPVGRFVPAEELPDPYNVDLALEVSTPEYVLVHPIWLNKKVDGKVVQKGNTGDMLYTIPQIIAYLSGVFTLEEGDIILTGTPAGQSLVPVGSKITASMSTAGKLVDSMEMDVVWREEGYKRDAYWLAGLKA
jgi:acylpyruvate hydrolase